MTNQNTKTFKHFLNVFFALVIGFAMIAPASAQAYVPRRKRIGVTGKCKIQTNMKAMVSKHKTSCISPYL